MSVSLQLYSMRKHADQMGLLGALATIGISRVEGYGGVYGNPLAYRAAMDANGIIMPSGHMDLKQIEVDFAGTLHLAQTLGMGRVFAPYLEEPDRPGSSAGYRNLAKRLTKVARKYSDEGIEFGWHNHDFEFMALPDGSVPMEVLLEEAPEIKWEADLAWIQRSGRDPMEYIQRFGDRLSSVHVKDIAVAGTNSDEDGWSDLGAGTMDWASLLLACRSENPDVLYVLEHDNPVDPIAYATRSAAAFATLWEQTHA